MRWIGPTVFLCCLGSTLAQDSLALHFRQDNLTSDNDLRLAWQQPLGAGSLVADNTLRYKLFQSNSGTNADYSLENSLNLGYERPLFIEWLVGIGLESRLFSDRRTGRGSDLSNQALLGSLRKSAAGGKTRRMALGIRQTERFGLLERGPTLAADFGDLWQGAGQRIQGAVHGTYDQFAEHENQHLRADIGYRVSFTDAAYFETSLAGMNRRQEFYTDSLQSTQSRTIDDTQWRNRFGYRLRPGVELYHRLDYVDQSTRINRWQVVDGERQATTGEDRTHLSLLNETGIEVVREQFQSRLNLRIDNRQNRYYVDYNQALYQLTAGIDIQAPGLVDSLRWESILARQTHDTPDTTNDDDRDEWRWSSSLDLGWRLSPFLTTALGMKVNLFHLIYLYSSRSAENHWNRSLILWTRTQWWHGDWFLASYGQVHANYFAYDYDDILEAMEQPRRSFVHRSLELNQDVFRNLGPRWRLEMQLRALWEDDGRLDWGAFLQEVQSERTQQEIVLRSRHRLQAWELWYGYLSHVRVKTYADGNRSDEEWRGNGPLLGVQRLWPNRYRLSADLRFIQVQDIDREYLLPKVTVQVAWLP